MYVSILANPPFSFTTADLSNMDLGIVWPDKSSMAAGKLSEASTLEEKRSKKCKVGGKEDCSEVRQGTVSSLAPARKNYLNLLSQMFINQKELESLLNEHPSDLKWFEVPLEIGRPKRPSNFPSEIFNQSCFKEIGSDRRILIPCMLIQGALLNMN